MANRMYFPQEALEDFSALLSLSGEQLRLVVDLLDEDLDESKMFDVVEERLNASPSTARSILALVMFLRTVSSRGSSPDDIVEGIRRLIEEHGDAAKEELLKSLEIAEPHVRAISTPSPKWIRRKKIQRLAEGPLATFESCRTVCQLRPLFEGGDTEEFRTEEIAGLVGNILVELHLNDPNNDETILFNLTAEQLEELIEVLERAQQKMVAIRQRYGKELLNFKDLDENV